MGAAKKFDEQLAKQIEVFVAVGLTHEQIAYIIGMTAKTMRKHYKQQLALGKARVDGAIGGGLVKKALKGDVTCMIFYLKTKCGWKETVTVEKEQLPEINARRMKLVNGGK